MQSCGLPKLFWVIGVYIIRHKMPSPLHSLYRNRGVCERTNEPQPLALRVNRHLSNAAPLQILQEKVILEHMLSVPKIPNSFR